MSLAAYITLRSLLEHALFRGGAGTGKTSLLLMPLVEQLISHAGRKRNASVFICDMKGDPAFFASARLTANRYNLPFKWLTLDPERITYGFNPFLQSHFKSKLTVSERSSMLVRAMGLDFGNRYGATYFRDLAQLLIRSIVELDEVLSFVELADYVKNRPKFLKKLPNKVADDTSHLSAVLDDLADPPALNVHPKRNPAHVIENMIDMPSLLDKPQVVYFYLQAARQPLLCDAAAKLAAISLIQAATMKENVKTNTVYMVMDEFHRIVSQEMCIFLQQARSFGLPCILSTQTTSDLTNEAGDFRDIIEESTNIKIDLSANSVEQSARLMAEAREVIGYQATIPGPLTDAVLTQVAQPMVNVNDLLEMGAKREIGLLRVRTPDPKGLTQLAGHQVPVRLQFHIPEDEYQRRSCAPWPAAEVGTLENLDTEVVSEIPTPSRKKGNEEQKEKRDFQERLARLGRELSDEI